MPLRLAMLEQQLSASTPAALSFSPQLEQDFELEDRSARVARAILGCWALILFEILLVVYDTAYAHLHVRVVENVSVQARLALCVGLVVTILVMRHLPLGLKVREGGLIAMLWLTMAIGAWLAIKEPHIRCQLELYALGVVPMIGGIVMRLRFTHALFMSLVGLIFLIIVSHLAEMPYPYMAFSVSFVFMAYCLFTLMANYLTERSARHAYLMNCMDHLTLENTVSHNLQLHEMARRDSLTGLYNRRFLIEALAHYVRHDSAGASATGVSVARISILNASAEKAMQADMAANETTLPVMPHGHCLALALMDVDHFKAFNDSYGHVEGDRCLSLLAETLKEAVGERGIVARYGGEEFVVLMPVATVSEALHEAQALRRAVAGLGVSHRTSEAGHVTLSLGLVVHSPATLREASASARDEEAESLLHIWIQQADEALYQAKESGRDRVCLARADLNGGDGCAP